MSTNSLRDFEQAASQFAVTHLVTLSQTEMAGTMLRMIRLPEGPTFWFQIREFSLIQDLLAMHWRSRPKPLSRKHHAHRRMREEKRLKHAAKHGAFSVLPRSVQLSMDVAPLVILNGFSADDKHRESAPNAKQRNNASANGEKEKYNEVLLWFTVDVVLSVAFKLKSLSLFTVHDGV